MFDFLNLVGLVVILQQMALPAVAMVLPSSSQKLRAPQTMSQFTHSFRHSSTPTSELKGEPWIRVRIGNYFNGGRTQGQEVVCREGQILVGNSKYKGDQVVLDTSKTTGNLWAGRRYLGEFWVATQVSSSPAKRGASVKGCALINRVPLETYLASVLEAEFSSKWSSSAVDAQVIAARSYAIRRILDQKGRKDSLWDVEQTVKDQVYNGIGAVEASVLTNVSLAQAAVRRTRGRILVTEKGSSQKSLSPLRALYHSTCGGRTSDPKSTWRKEVRGIQPVVCGECESSPKARWRVELSEAEVLNALGAMPRPDRVQSLSITPLRRRIQGLEVLERSSDGRALVLEMRTKDENGKSLRPFKFLASEFRAKVGTTRLPSTWFEFSGEFWDPKIQQSRWILKGSGYGHGLGLCQWGAKTLGEKGATANEILVKYYPQARVEITYD